MTERLACTDAYLAELNDANIPVIITTTTAPRGCTPNIDASQIFQSATGTKTSCDSKTCTLVNTVVITLGTVPQTPTP